MELRRVSRQRGITVKDRGQFFVIYLDKAERFQGRVFIDSRDSRDLVSNCTGPYLHRAVADPACI